MAKAPQRHKAEVALPGSPGGRFIRFTHGAMCTLESLYPDDWFKTVFDGLDTAKLSIIDACIENAIVGDEPIDLEFYTDEPGRMEKVIIAIKDALLLTCFGKTQDELIAEQEKKREAAMVEMGMDPELVKKLTSLNDAGLLDTAPASSRQNSTTSAE